MREGLSGIRAWVRLSERATGRCAPPACQTLRPPKKKTEERRRRKKKKETCAHLCEAEVGDAQEADQPRAHQLLHGLPAGEAGGGGSGGGPNQGSGCEEVATRGATDAAAAHARARPQARALHAPTHHVCCRVTEVSASWVPGSQVSGQWMSSRSSRPQPSSAIERSADALQQRAWGGGSEHGNQLKCARVFEACGSGSSGMGSMGRAGSRHVAAAAMGRAWAGGPAQYSTHRTASGRFSSFHSLLVMKSSSRRPCGVDGGMSGWVQGWVPAQHACSQRRRSRASPTSSSEQQQQRSRKASCLESAAHLRNEVLQALPHQRLVAVRGGAVNVAVAACSVGGAGGRRSRSGSAGSRQRPRPRSSNRRHGRNPSLPAALVGRPQRAHTRAPS